MRERKSLQELTISNNFMFGAVMADENNCRDLLELVLKTPIEKVEVSKEKSIVYHPLFKGVRLDVYSKDKNNTRYNVEMQALAQKELGKRSRYYTSQIDMEMLGVGEDYENLPKSYVIFVCDFDPFGGKKYCYTFRKKCEEYPQANLEDGQTIIFLSTLGENDDQVDEPLKKFLKFVGAKLPESTKDFGDAFVKRLQESIHMIKQDRDMEVRYMLFDLVMRDAQKEAREEGFIEGREEGREIGLKEGRKEGRAEGRADSLMELLGLKFGDVTESVREKVRQEKDMSVLSGWLQMAIHASSLEEFEKLMNK